MFIKGEGIFRSLGNLLKGGALSLGRSIFQDVTAALAGPILNAFRTFFNPSPHVSRSPGVFTSRKVT